MGRMDQSEEEEERAASISETKSFVTCQSLRTGVAQSLANFLNIFCVCLHLRSLLSFQCLINATAAANAAAVVTAATAATSFLISSLSLCVCVCFSGSLIECKVYRSFFGT